MSTKDDSSVSVVYLAQYIFGLGQRFQRANDEATALVSGAYDMGYAKGRADVEKEIGLDGRAVLKSTGGGTGAPAAN